MSYYEVLSKTDMEQIHETSLSVMSKTGLDIQNDAARDLLSRGGARIDGTRVFFPTDMVTSAVQFAPERFCLHAPNPENSVEIGGDSSVFLPANCAAFVSDPDSGRRYGTLADYENLVRLTAQSRYLDMSSSVLVEPSDIPPEQRNMRMLHTTFRNSDKCFMGGATGAKAARETLDMVSILFGISQSNLPDKARVISIPCSLTPLKYDRSMLDCLMTYAAAGQPVIVNSLGVSGTTAPGTLAGTLVVENAEILAGITIAQLVREGTPVVYGGASTIANMRTGAVCVGAPEMALNNAMTAQMARFYKLPSRGCGTLTEAHEPDCQSAYESMMNLTTAVTSGLNMVLHAAGSLSSINCMSFEKFIIDEEMCGMAKRIKTGVNVDAETMGLGVIDQVGPGGHFLTSPHTFQHFRSEFFMPDISERTGYDSAAEQDIVSRANRKWKERLDRFQPPQLDPDIHRDLSRYVEGRVKCLS